MKMFLLFLFLIVVLIAGIIGIIGIPGYEEPEITKGYEGELIELQGTKIRFIQKGKGPDILLIHTLQGIAEDWEYLAVELEKNYRVTYLDRPGQGFSTFQSTTHPLGYNVEMITALINALSLTDVIIAGHGYGGSIALALAVQDIPRARGYILLSPSAFPAGGLQLFSRVISTPVIGRGLIRTIKGFYLPTVTNSELSTAFNPETVPGDYYKKRIDLFFQTKSIVSSAVEKMYLNRDIKAIADFYQEIQKPILIIHGEYDKINSISLSHDLDNLLPNSTLIVLSDAGHIIMYPFSKTDHFEKKNPEKIKEAIDAFFLSESTHEPPEEQ